MIIGSLLWACIFLQILERLEILTLFLFLLRCVLQEDMFVNVLDYSAFSFRFTSIFSGVCLGRSFLFFWFEFYKN